MGRLRFGLCCAYPGMSCCVVDGGAAAVTELSAKGADRFVLDLRDNPGGLVQAGSEIARVFMGGDVTVVYTENRPDRPGETLDHITNKPTRKTTLRP